jgi:divalent metal cation (Fe/Co/Zn/Cd) transporter
VPSTTSRWIGHTLRAEVDLTVTADMTLTHAHEIAHHAEAHLLQRVLTVRATVVQHERCVVEVWSARAG